MTKTSLYALLALAAAQQVSAGPACDTTYGWAWMSNDHYIHYEFDKHPGEGGVSVPGDPAYDWYLVEAGSLRPGERKRLEKSLMPFRYLASSDTYQLITGRIGAEAGELENSDIVNKNDLNLSCYHDVLGTGDDQKLRLLLLKQWNAIQDCIIKRK